MSRSFCLVVLFLVAFTATFDLALSGCADQPNALISNMFQNNAGAVAYTTGSLAAEAFVTPNNGKKMDLTTVVVRVGGPGNSGQSNIELWSAAGNQPGARIAVLGVVVNPSSQTDITVQTGVNPLMTPNTMYFIVIRPTSAGATLSWVYTTGNSFIVGSGSLPFVHADSPNAGANWNSGVAGRSSSFMVIGCTDNNVPSPSPSPATNAYPSVMPPVASSSPAPFKPFSPAP